MAVEMDAFLGKRRILETYLNMIEFGYGIFEVEAAARYYFGASAVNVTNHRAAFLSIITPFLRSRYAISNLPNQLERHFCRVLRVVSAETLLQEANQLIEELIHGPRWSNPERSVITKNE